MGLQRFAPTVAAGVVLLLAGTVGCSGDEPQSSAVDEQPTADEQEPENNANGQGGSAEDGDTTISNGDQPVDDPTQYETAEDMPDELLQAEMETFVGEFLAAMNDATATGDTSTAREMSKSECGPCWNPLDRVDQLYDEGHRVEGAEFSDGFTVSVEEIHGDRIETQVSGEFSAGAILDENGNEVDSYPAASFIYYFGIDRGDDGNYIISRGADFT